MLRTFLIAASVLFAGATAHAEVQYDMRVDGMTCPFCVATAERMLKKMDGVTRVSTDLDAGVVSVCAEDGVDFTDEQMKKLFLDKGFSYRSMTKRDGCTIA
jgi:mercuric ion binding protein